MHDLTDIFTPGYVAMGMPNKLFNINYIFDEKSAMRKKKTSDRQFRQVILTKKKNKMLFKLMVALFVIIAPVFLVMFIKSITTPEILLNLSFRYALVALVPIACALPVLMMMFKDNYNYYSDITKDDIYTTAEKFFVFTNKDRNITDAKISFEQEKAILNIFYEEEDEKLGMITKFIPFSDFSIVKTESVQTPLLSINEGVYYIPAK